jgi:predicted regulator of Ras-like GTPase activity (Roadblock/LC7/MglB family)
MAVKVASRTAMEVRCAMAESGFGDYFIRDVDDDALDAEGVQVPVVVPQQPAPQPAPAPVQPAAPAPPQPAAPVQQAPAAQPAPAAVQPAPAPLPQPVPQPSAQTQREDQLTRVLNVFMGASPDVQASALVSLDGFIIASALPRGMQEDRVGAMSAAILGLGERAAAELGRGALSQVFIEGADGYVLLLAAGDRAVLTVLAGRDAKLGLVLYDMKTTAARIGEILR